MFSSKDFVQSFKIQWSLNWRIFLYILLFSIPFFLIGRFSKVLDQYFQVLYTYLGEPILLIFFGVVIFLLALLLIVLIFSYIINQKLWEKIIKIPYSGFKVNFFHNNEQFFSVNRINALCLLWSFSWRSIIFLTILSAGVFSVAYLFGISLDFWHLLLGSDHLLDLQNIPTQIIELLSSTLAMIWLIKGKKTGRFLRIENTE